MFDVASSQVLLFTLVGLVFGAVLLTLSLVVQLLFGIGKPSAIKNLEYECGMKPLAKSHLQFDIKYYIYALMFIVFDVEFAFLLPWGLYLGQFEGSIFSLSPELASSMLLGFFEAFIFVGILALGLYYAWRKGALEWE